MIFLILFIQLNQFDMWFQHSFEVCFCLSHEEVLRCAYNKDKYLALLYLAHVKIFGTVTLNFILLAEQRCYWVNILRIFQQNRHFFAILP